MRKKTIIFFGISVFVLLGAFMGDKVLISNNFSYACWRVCHPFGPNTARFHYIVERATPKDIPVLIGYLNSKDSWWVGDLLSAWFPDATTNDLNRTLNATQWANWWQANSSNIHNLVLPRDPRF
jgi:hypothetical protein